MLYNQDKRKKLSKTRKVRIMKVLTKMEVMELVKQLEQIGFMGNKEERRRLLGILGSKQTKIFKCRCCGKRVEYLNLETWLCNFEKEEYTCCYCYEGYMGEEL